MSAEIPEPDEGTIVAWFDRYDGLRAVARRNDAFGGDDAPELRWYFADGGDLDPVTWAQLVEDLDDFRGPITLLAHRNLSTGGDVRNVV